MKNGCLFLSGMLYYFQIFVPLFHITRVKIEALINPIPVFTIEKAAVAAFSKKLFDNTHHFADKLRRSKKHKTCSFFFFIVIIGIVGFHVFIGHIQQRA